MSRAHCKHHYSGNAKHGIQKNFQVINLKQLPLKLKFNNTAFLARNKKTKKSQP